MKPDNLNQKLIDYRIIELSTRTAKEIITEVMSVHIASCPVSKQLNAKVAFASGVAATVGLLSTIVSVLVYFHKGG